MPAEKQREKGRKPFYIPGFRPYVLKNSLKHYWHGNKSQLSGVQAQINVKDTRHFISFFTLLRGMTFAPFFNISGLE